MNCHTAQFEEQVGRACNFTVRTAQRYMALTRNCSAASQKRHESLLTISIEKLAPTVNRLIEGQTLTQLMFDWGILKKKSKRIAASTESADDDGPRDAAVRQTRSGSTRSSKLSSLRVFMSATLTAPN